MRPPLYTNTKLEMEQNSKGDRQNFNPFQEMVWPGC
ncbi:rCG63337 [Rattus norvegicus]|uniref:RCG63337 n=1 Tax=Rattus norvegicus TaxID=10116 RepID=A6JQ05_RAT|nr:rCG63337 [Rattus norvegicus]